MKDYTYFQLLAFFYDDILTSISQGDTKEHALAIALDTFFHKETEEKFLENFIVLINSIDMKSRFNVVISQTIVDLFLEYLVKYETLSIEDYLNESETEHFLEVLFDVKHYVKNI